MSSIDREDTIEILKDLQKDHLQFCLIPFRQAIERVQALPSADRPRKGWADEAISIIDDMQREGIVDYQQAWEFRMRARMKGAEDERKDIQSTDE